MLLITYAIGIFTILVLNIDAINILLRGIWYIIKKYHIFFKIMMLIFEWIYYKELFYGRTNVPSTQNFSVLLNFSLFSGFRHAQCWHIWVGLFPLPVGCTTFLSEVHFGDELRIVSGDWYTLFVVKSHQNETKVGM